jgi:hypothetical protein
MRPAVWPWYVAYVASLAILYIVVCAGAVVIMFLVPPSDAEFGPAERTIISLVVIAPCAFLSIICGIAPFLPRRPWAWYYHLVLIALGFTSCCWWPFVIPLLIFWIKPETKAYFDNPSEEAWRSGSDRWTDPTSP